MIKIAVHKDKHNHVMSKELIVGGQVLLVEVLG